jgi:hypothetical protein
MFSNPFFEEYATMTLGLTEIANEGESRNVFVLCFSHLRFYNNPMSVESVEDRTRATIYQFRVTVLGSVLGN